jgi:hypothetical protein
MDGTLSTPVGLSVRERSVVLTTERAEEPSERDWDKVKR